VSHDRLTRMLQADWSGQRLLESAFRPLFVWEQGYLILDDTVVPKPFATAMEGLAWVFSSQAGQPVYGFSLVLLVWTDGSVRIPLGIRLWRKGGPSKYALALELLSYARNRLRCHPEYVLFDAWYPSKVLLKRIRDDGWYFVCRLKKNRRFNGQPLWGYRRHPYGAETGRLSGGLKVLVVRYGAKDLRDESPDTAGRGSPSPLSEACANRGSDPCMQGSARVEWLSSAVRAGSAASSDLLLGRVLRAGAGTA
jgi:hypothetical protein